MKSALDRVDRALTTLQCVVDDERTKQEARAEVERLEKQLAAAKAKLKGGNRAVGQAAKEAKPQCSTQAAASVSYRDVWDWAAAQGY